jgi:hypothetical protein
MGKGTARRRLGGADGQQDDMDAALPDTFGRLQDSSAIPQPLAIDCQNIGLCVALEARDRIGQFDDRLVTQIDGAGVAQSQAPGVLAHFVGHEAAL